MNKGLGGRRRTVDKGIGGRSVMEGMKAWKEVGEENDLEME